MKKSGYAVIYYKRSFISFFPWTTVLGFPTAVNTSNFYGFASGTLTESN